MGLPVELPDALVMDARIAGEARERSIAGQVEFWAKLGRAIELLMGGGYVMALLRNEGVRPLSEALDAVDTPEGHKRVRDLLARQPFPHYSEYPGQERLLIRIDGDGTNTVGRFVNRRFVSVEASARAHPKRPLGKEESVPKQKEGKARA
jgi:hypothetical protein